MAEVGIMPPPEGVTPDFYSRTSLQNTLIILFGVAFALATISVILRLYTALGIVKKLDWDICKCHHYRFLTVSTSLMLRYSNSIHCCSLGN